jgi:hypothetical protein
LLEGLLAKAGFGRREVTLRRSVFEDAGGTQTRIPLDESLGVNATSFSRCAPLHGPGWQPFFLRRSLRGANAIIASRCCQLSGRFEDFWEDAA